MPGGRVTAARGVRQSVVPSPVGGIRSSGSYGRVRRDGVPKDLVGGVPPDSPPADEPGGDDVDRGVDWQDVALGAAGTLLVV